MTSFAILNIPVKPPPIKPPPLEPAVCPHCCCTSAWVFVDPVSGPEVICECLFGTPEAPEEFAHADHRFSSREA